MTMVKIGIIGFGGMGKMHLGIHNQLKNVEVTAVADVDPTKLKTGASAQKINIGTGGGSLDPDKTLLFKSPDDLIKKADVDIIDICTPTYLHAELAVKALRSGRHCLCEKPMALNSKECAKVVAAAKAGKKNYMTAQCIRFWPEYVYLRDTVKSRRLGKLLSMRLQRRTEPPTWGWKNWFGKIALSGGGLLDLHVHDVDFLVYTLGKPASVRALGARGFSKGYDSVSTLYDYGNAAIVEADGDMTLPKGAPFKMAYQAVFANGMIDYDCTRGEKALLEYLPGKPETCPKVQGGDGYFHEIAYFVECAEKRRKITICPPDSSALSIKVAEAERKSCETGKEVKIS